MTLLVQSLLIHWHRSHLFKSWICVSDLMIHFSEEMIGLVFSPCMNVWFHLNSILFVDQNELTGTIPIELGQLTALQKLSLCKCLSALLFRRNDGLLFQPCMHLWFHLILFCHF